MYSVSPCSVQPEGTIDSSVGGIAKQCPHPVTRSNPVTHPKSRACPKHCEITTKMCRKAASRLWEDVVTFFTSPYDQKILCPYLAWQSPPCDRRLRAPSHRSPVSDPACGVEGCAPGCRGAPFWKEGEFPVTSV